VYDNKLGDADALLPALD